MNATMLYGHIERADERVQHLIKLREVQDKRLRRSGRRVSGPTLRLCWHGVSFGATNGLQASNPAITTHW